MKNIAMTTIFGLLTVTPAFSQTTPTIEPAGMQIVWDSLKKEFNGFGIYNGTEGTNVTLAIKGGGKSIIAFNRKQSKVSIQYGGKDLGGEFGSWGKFSEDGKIMRLEAKTDQLPAGKATNLKLTGSVEIVTASKSETKSVGPQALKVGDKLTFGEDFTCEVTKLGKPTYGNDELEITFKWKHEISKLSAVRFFNKEGKEIESKSSGRSSFGSLGKMTVTKSYKLKKKSDVLKIEMELWTDAETVTVPLNVELGLGGQVKS